MSNKHSKYPRTHQLRRDMPIKFPQATFERRGCPNYRNPNSLSKAEKETAGTNAINLIAELQLPSRRHETDEDAVQAWMESPPRVFVVDTDRRTGRFAGLEKIINDDRLWDTLYHDSEAEEIGFHLTILPNAFRAREETILGHDVFMSTPMEPGKDKFTDMDYCISRGWIEPRAAVVAEHSIAAIEKQLGPIPPQA